MLVVALTLRHLLLTLLAVPVLWCARASYRDWKISRTRARNLRNCREAHRAKSLEARNRKLRVQGLTEAALSKDASGPASRARGANWREGSGWQ